jgi:hypothetical protein
MLQRARIYKKAILKEELAQDLCTRRGTVEYLGAGVVSRSRSHAIAADQENCQKLTECIAFNRTDLYRVFQLAIIQQADHLDGDLRGQHYHRR